jgi:hypothetical protein
MYLSKLKSKKCKMFENEFKSQNSEFRRGRARRAPYLFKAGSKGFKGPWEKNYRGGYLRIGPRLCHFYQTNPFFEFAMPYLSMKYENKEPSRHKNEPIINPIEPILRANKPILKPLRIERSHFKSNFIDKKWPRRKTRVWCSPALACTSVSSVPQW